MSGSHSSSPGGHSRHWQHKGKPGKSQSLLDLECLPESEPQVEKLQLKDFEKHFPQSFLSEVISLLDGAYHVFRSSREKKSKRHGKKRTIQPFLDKYQDIQRLMDFLYKVPRQVQELSQHGDRLTESNNKNETLKRELHQTEKDLEQQRTKLKTSKTQYEDEIERLKAEKEESNIRLKDEQQRAKQISSERDIAKRETERVQRERLVLSVRVEELTQELFNTTQEHKADQQKNTDAMNSMKQQLDDKDTLIQQQQIERQKIVTRNEEKLQEYTQALSGRDVQIKDLSLKLAVEMSTKLSADESSVENVSIKNRPMNVGEEYSLICSNQWLDAKGEVDEACGDGVLDYLKLRLLCDLIHVTEEATKSALRGITDLQRDIWCDPITAGLTTNNKVLAKRETSANDGPHDQEINQNVVPTELKNMVGDRFRITSDEVNIKALQQRVLVNVARRVSDSELHSIWEVSKQQPAVLQYIEKLVRVTWKMVIQRPAMEYRTPDNGQWLGETYQEVFWNSDNCKDPLVIEVFPMLYHGKSLMVKGKVLLLDPSKLPSSESADCSTHIVADN